MEEKEKKESKEQFFTIQIKGKPFRCDCGCNVFRKPKGTKRPNLYECNACGEWYETD